MKVLLQWSLASPQDWVEIDAHAWAGLARKPLPKGGETIDHKPGWIFDVAIQGWMMRGCDHIALEPISGNGVRVYRWFDDLADVETDYRHGQVIEFRPGWVDRTLTSPDGSMRHQGPDQRLVEYAEDMDAHRPFVASECGGLAVEYRPWADFPMPPEQIVRHGVWLSDELLDAHMARQRPVSWREWM